MEKDRSIPEEISSPWESARRRALSPAEGAGFLKELNRTISGLPQIGFQNPAIIEDIMLASEQRAAAKEELAETPPAPAKPEEQRRGILRRIIRR